MTPDAVVNRGTVATSDIECHREIGVPAIGAGQSCSESSMPGSAAPSASRSP